MTDFRPPRVSSPDGLRAVAWLRPTPRCGLAMLVWLCVASAILASTCSAQADRWVVEQMPGGSIQVDDHNRVEIQDASGCTLWWREPVTAPVEISYDVTVVSAGGPHDRVSDVNCFWMAQERAAPAVAPFAAGRRHGRFTDYDSLETYYVGIGGNDNTTTRFRRYAAGRRPLCPENDRRDREFLLEPNRTYHLTLVARDGCAEMYRDGRLFFRYADPHPLRTGWFALRTVHSHLIVEHLAIAPPTTAVPRRRDLGSH
jgi:hypothetical protein